MTNRILLAVGADRSLRSTIAALEAAGLEVVSTTSGADPLEAMDPDSPVATVVVDCALLNASLADFAVQLEARSPLTTCVAIGETPEGASDAVPAPRYVPDPTREPQLREAIEQALGDFRARRAAQLYRQEVGAADQLKEATVRRLYRLTRALSEDAELAATALRAAEALRELLPGRGIQVQLWDPAQAGVGAEVSSGPEMGTEMYRLPLEAPMGRVGELIVDSVDQSGERLDLGSELILAAVAAPVAAAAESQFQRLDRKRAQEATLLAMARIADMRDNETGQHLARVSHYSVMIAQGMLEDGHCLKEITPEFLEDLFRCAPLHDLGKVAIPDAILLKAGRLSPMEWELMKSHPSVGAQILDQLMDENPVLCFVSMGRDIAHCHHEKWDGTGYPQELSGDDIPLSARIVALADIYDALTSERSYKSAWTHSQALEYLRELSGTHLDPRVLSAFIAREDQIDQIRMRLADDPVAGPEDARHAA